MSAKLDFFCRYSLSSFASRQITWVYRQRILKVANFTEIKTVLQIFVNLIDRKTFNSAVKLPFVFIVVLTVRNSSMTLVIYVSVNLKN